MSITAINVHNQFRGKVGIIEGTVVSAIDVETRTGPVVTWVIATL